jgi:uncharacterized protein (DUF849 family)
VIKAALNGGRTRAENASIPLTPNELAASAKESVAAGAGAIHFHVRAVDGRESLDPDDVATALTAVRSAIPATPVGVSTGAWILRNAELRHEMVSRWTVLPDFASVNFKEDGAVPLAEMLLSRGVALEAGLSDLHGTEVFVTSGLAPRCLRILLEPFESSKEAALKALKQIEAMLEVTGLTPPCLLHGLNQTAWALLDEAAARGYDTRVGFEDILTLPDGTCAQSNGALVAEAFRRTRSSPAGSG